jgi:putative transposase
VEQIAQALRRVEGGVAVAEVCRDLGITETTFHRGERKFGGLGTPELRELRQLRDEYRKLKQLVADLTLDRTMLQETLRTKW